MHVTVHRHMRLQVSAYLNVCDSVCVCVCPKKKKKKSKAASTEEETDYCTECAASLLFR